MSVGALGRAAGLVLLTMSLAGCMDVTADVHVTGPGTAEASVTETLAAPFYDMIKSASAKGGPTTFCARGNLTENADGSATCVEHRHGPFAVLAFNEHNDGDDVTFTSAGQNQVRVSLGTARIRQHMTRSVIAHGRDGADVDDPTTHRQIEEMLLDYFRGHTLTFRVSGAEIVESDMPISADGRTAEIKIAFPDIIAGTPGLPEELYAVVRVE